MDAMKTEIGGEVTEANLREALGLSRVEMKKLRAKAPANGCYQSGTKQGGKPKALWPWYWNKEAVAWLSKEIGLHLDEKKEMESSVKEAYVVVTKCSFPNKRIFEAKLDNMAIMMIQCKDSTKLRIKQRVKVKFSNGIGHLVSDKSGRAK